MLGFEVWLPIIYIFAGLLGLVIGSFLNVVIYRVPRNESVAFPASHCPSCNSEIKWYDNIPVISYILLGAKCRNCHCHIPIRYTIVELANTVLWLLCVFCLVQNSELFLGVPMEQSLVYAGLAMITCSVFICVFFIDLEHMIIPDRFHVIMVALGIIAILSNLLLKDFNDGISWLDRLIGAFGGGALFLIFFYGSYLILKREGMGFGDVKLVASVGLLIGWKNLALSIIIGAVVGSIILVLPHLFKKSERFKEYPFGPFLTAGMLISMLVGKAIIDWYIGLII